MRGVSESSDDENSSTSPTGGFTRFARDSSRQSLTSQNVLKWASAQERAQESHDESADEDERPPPPRENRAALEIQTDIHKVSCVMGL